jgi:predicted DNA-binding protein (UPF0278 family)
MSDFTQPYTPEGKHPEDAIYEVKEFFRKLQDVQEDYFQRLSKGLKLTEEGEEYLFDYIYNVNNNDQEIDDFAHYVQTLGKNYRNFTNN